VINHVRMTRLDDDLLSADPVVEERPDVVGLGGTEAGEDVEGAFQGVPAAPDLTEPA
jgi:hypothetical protein